MNALKVSQQSGDMLNPIILVEDDSIDVRFVMRTLTAVGVKNPVVVAHDGVEALTILSEIKPDSVLQNIELIILDLNLPRMSGLEFLEKLREDKNFKNCAVIILTTSDDESDRKTSSQLAIDGYFIKGKDNQRLKEYLRKYC